MIILNKYIYTHIRQISKITIIQNFHSNNSIRGNLVGGEKNIIRQNIYEGVNFDVQQSPATGNF